MTTRRPIFASAHDAIRAGQACAPSGVAYRQGTGWFVYDLAQGINDVPGAVPEFVCVKSGRLPVALTDEGETILRQLMRL